MWKRALSAAFVVFLVGAAAYASFYIAPDERTMHVLYRIFYFHAAAAWPTAITTITQASQ